MYCIVFLLLVLLYLICVVSIVNHRQDLLGFIHFSLIHLLTNYQLTLLYELTLFILQQIAQLVVYPFQEQLVNNNDEIW